MTMKKSRLDHILYRLGYVSEEHINRALIHQKQHGRKLGSNLLEMKYITEEQLRRRFPGNSTCRLISRPRMDTSRRRRY